MTDKDVFDLDALANRDAAKIGKQINFRGNLYRLRPFLDSSDESLGLFSVDQTGAPMINTRAITAGQDSAGMDEIFKALFRAMLNADDVESFILEAMDGSLSSESLDQLVEWIMAQVVGDPSQAG